MEGGQQLLKGISTFLPPPWWSAENSFHLHSVFERSSIDFMLPPPSHPGSSSCAIDDPPPPQCLARVWESMWSERFYVTSFVASPPNRLTCNQWEPLDVNRLPSPPLAQSHPRHTPMSTASVFLVTAGAACSPMTAYNRSNSSCISPVDIPPRKQADKPQKKKLDSK